ncbi:MAG TPA: mandelate racemase/muconate lactonizing enzyme family protein [Gaiellaceae bacterium]|nr:mandelate racemase/muconate lactonizing enzyme family protein [Gaiellaceae bacterium]
MPTARDLSISSLETIPIRVPLARPFHGSHYHMTHRSTIVVRITTVDGIVGEAYAGDEDSSLLEIDRIINDELAPKLIGEDAFAIERCWEALRPATFDILRDRRLGLVACACVDAALWDAVGKALHQPLWRLWGGYRSRLPLIAIGGYYDTGVDLPTEVSGLLELGVGGMKLKVGGLDPDADAARVRTVRETAGESFILAVDANQAWTPQDAIRFARLVEDAGLVWFEEPCRWHNDLRAMRDVRNVAGARVCAGQSEYSAAGCGELIVQGAVDVCNFDSSWSGGATEWRRVAGIAHAFDVQMAHHEEPQIAAHLLASIPHGTFVECFHPDRDPIWWNLVANRPTLVDGSIELSDAPGLGWELDEDYLDAHRVAR